MKQEKKEINTLITKLGELEKEHTSAIRQKQETEELSLWQKIMVVKAEINSYYSKKGAAAFQVHKNRRYEYGETVGKMLALRTKQRAVRNKITEVKGQDGILHTKIKDIIKVFEKFYQDLYRQDSLDSLPSNETKTVLGRQRRLSEEMKQELAKESTIEEVLSALQSMASGKAAGPDRIPLELYKAIQEEIALLFLDLFLGIQYNGVPPESWRGADIVVFFKKGKPSDNPASYRPISLMNVDTKLY